MRLSNNSLLILSFTKVDFSLRAGASLDLFSVNVLTLQNVFAEKRCKGQEPGYEGGHEEQKRPEIRCVVVVTDNMRQQSGTGSLKELTSRAF